MTYPIVVRLRALVQIHNGSYHLFWKHVEFPIPPHPGMMLSGYGIPVEDHEAGFANKVRFVHIKEHEPPYVDLYGHREPALTLEEVKAAVYPNWIYDGRIKNVIEAGTQDSPADEF